MTPFELGQIAGIEQERARWHALAEQEISRSIADAERRTGWLADRAIGFAERVWAVFAAPGSPHPGKRMDI